MRPAICSAANMLWLSTSIIGDAGQSVGWSCRFLRPDRYKASLAYRAAPSPTFSRLEPRFTLVAKAGNDARPDRDIIQYQRVCATLVASPVASGGTTLQRHIIVSFASVHFHWGNPPSDEMKIEGVIERVFVAAKRGILLAVFQRGRDISPTVIRLARRKTSRSFRVKTYARSVGM